MGYVSLLEDIQESLYIGLQRLSQKLSEIEKDEPRGMPHGNAEVLSQAKAIYQSTENMLAEVNERLEYLTSPNALDGVENPFSVIAKLYDEIRSQKASIGLLQNYIDAEIKLNSELNEELVVERAKNEELLVVERAKRDRLRKKCNDLEFALSRRNQEIESLNTKIQTQADKLEFEKAMDKIRDKGIPKNALR